MKNYCLTWDFSGSTATLNVSRVLGDCACSISKPEDATLSTESGTLSEKAIQEFDVLKNKHKPRRVPDHIVATSRMFEEDMAWIDKLKEQEYTIIDIGNPRNRPDSFFYESEISRLGWL